MLRTACGVMALLFAFAAAVQVNDPDPVRWIALYAAAFIVSAAGAAGRPVRAAAPLAVGFVALAWSLGLFLDVHGVSDFMHMFDSWEMRSPTIEKAREATGLLIVAAWMVPVSRYHMRRSRGSRVRS